MATDPKFIAEKVKSLASGAGFFKTGIARAKHLEKDAAYLQQWLQNNYHASMDYMENHYEKRTDPRELLEGARSVIVFLHNYFPAEHLPPSKYNISTYAYGRDYHKVIRKKLKPIVNMLKEEFGSKQCRAFVDSAPVLERQWAVEAGLGWIGKNTCLIHPKGGSYYFISEIITDLELAYDEPYPNNLCGKCTRCLDLCPTSAFTAEGVMDAGRCISYLTIENKNSIPSGFHEQLSGMIFGCDICQDVCPWNKFSFAHNEMDFHPSKELQNMQDHDWENLSEPQFDALFSGSPIKRTKFSGLTRNIAAVGNKKPDQTTE